MAGEGAMKCGVCKRVIDMAAGEAAHYPCWWGCSGELRRLRKEEDAPICIDCLPPAFKAPFLGGGRPILSAADLPKIGEPLPSHIIAKVR